MNYESSRQQFSTGKQSRNYAHSLAPTKDCSR